MSDLDNLHIPETLKQITPIITCTIEGILEPEDIRRLLVPTVGDGGPPPSLHVEPEDLNDLKKIREKHHSLARAVASGIPQGMAGRICGYSESYVSVLLGSPAIKELVEMYRVQNGSASAVISEKLRTVGLKAVEKIDERLEADVENKIDLTVLKEIAKLGLDRAGHGPSSTHHVIEEKVDHVKIAELNLRARERSAQFIVPVHEVRQAVLPAPSSDDSNEAA